MPKDQKVPSSLWDEAKRAGAPPWHYSGDIIAIEFWTDPEVANAGLPRGLAEDVGADGHMFAFFGDWQFAGQNEEHLDPARYQYRQFSILVDALYRDTPVSWCPFMCVDNYAAIERGLIQGTPVILGSIHQTRTFAAPSPAAAPVESGTRFAASMSAHGQRMAEGQITLQQTMRRPPDALKRPIVSRRHFSRLDSAHGGPAEIDELVMAVTESRSLIDLWTASAEILFPEAPGQNLHHFQPRRVGQGYRFSMSYSIRNLKVLEGLSNRGVPPER